MSTIQIISYPTVSTKKGVHWQIHLQHGHVLRCSSTEAKHDARSPKTQTLKTKATHAVHRVKQDVTHLEDLPVLLGPAGIYVRKCPLEYL
jgi:hypothetical protein